MIGLEAIEQILAQYTKHGWKLRRVLLSRPLRDRVPGIAAVFEGVEIEEPGLDGLWFSRSSRPGITAWELRHLSAAPFAVVENVQDDIEQEDLELILSRAETRMAEAIGSRPSGH